MTDDSTSNNETKVVGNRVAASFPSLNGSLQRKRRPRTACRVLSVEANHASCHGKPDQASVVPREGENDGTNSLKEKLKISWYSSNALCPRRPKTNLLSLYIGNPTPARPCGSRPLLQRSPVISSSLDPLLLAHLKKCRSKPIPQPTQRSARHRSNRSG